MERQQKRFQIFVSHKDTLKNQKPYLAQRRRGAEKSDKLSPQRVAENSILPRKTRKNAKEEQKLYLTTEDTRQRSRSQSDNAREEKKPLLTTENTEKEISRAEAQRKAKHLSCGCSVDAKKSKSRSLFLREPRRF